MAAYSSHKVAELKELLKQRGLPTAGTKAELIAKLEENDKESSTGPTSGAGEETSAPEAKEPEKPKPAATTKTAEKKQPDTEGTAAKQADSTESKGEQEEPEMDYQKMVLEELDKRIKRAERFSGGNIEDLKKQKQRVEKFGIEKGQALYMLTGRNPVVDKSRINKRGGTVESDEKLAKRKKRFGLF